MEHECPIILVESHEGIVGGHYARRDTTQKILDIRLWCPTIHKDTKE